MMAGRTTATERSSGYHDAEAGSRAFPTDAFKEPVEGSLKICAIAQGVQRRCRAPRLDARLPMPEEGCERLRAASARQLRPEPMTPGISLAWPKQHASLRQADAPVRWLLDGSVLESTSGKMPLADARTSASRFLASIPDVIGKAVQVQLIFTKLLSRDIETHTRRMEVGPRSIFVVKEGEPGLGIDAAVVLARSRHLAGRAQTPGEQVCTNSSHHGLERYLDQGGRAGRRVGRSVGERWHLSELTGRPWKSREHGGIVPVAAPYPLALRSAVQQRDRGEAIDSEPVVSG